MIVRGIAVPGIRCKMSNNNDSLKYVGFVARRDYAIINYYHNKCDICKKYNKQLYKLVPKDVPKYHVWDNLLICAPCFEHGYAEDVMVTGERVNIDNNINK